MASLKRLRPFLELPDNARLKVHRSSSPTVRCDVDFDQPEEPQTSGASSDVEAKRRISGASTDMEVEDKDAKKMDDNSMEQNSTIANDESISPTEPESIDSTQKDSDTDDQWSPISATSDSLLNLWNQSSPSP